MSNKITGKDLGKMIKEALLNEVTFQDLKAFIGNTKTKNISRGTAGGISDITIDDLFKKDTGIAHQESPPPNSLDSSDVEYFINNPEKIDVDIQAQLIALTYWNNPSLYAASDAAQGKKDKLAKEIAELKVSIPRLEAAYKNAIKGKIRKPRKEMNGAKKRLRDAQSQLQNHLDGPMADAASRLEAYQNNKDWFDSISLKAREALDGLESLVASTAQQDQSVSSPIIKTAKGDYGIFDQDQHDLVTRLLKDKTTIKDKMAEVSRISKDFYDAVVDVSKLETKKPSQLLSEIMLIDLCNSMTKEFDSGSGAYLFEHFLAMIVGGVVTGKEKTEYGKMGAADFKMGDEFGSAKFYQKPSEAKQAVSGYKDLYKKNNNQPVSVTYVIGGKKQDVKQMGDPKRGSSDPARIVGIEVYTPKVVFDGTNFTINGVPATPPTGKSDITFNTTQKLGEPVGMIYLTTTRTSTFKEMLDSGIKQQEAEVQNLFEQFKLYFEELQSASSTAKSYIATGDTSTGNKTFNSLEKAENNFTNIVAGLEYEDRLGTDGRIIDQEAQLVNRIDEQKVTSDLLKKIIRESLKK